jgi:lipoprotein NlpD
MKYIFLIGFIVIFSAGCASHTPAPVINRSPQVTTASTTNKSSDWRPNTYTVKKGDTLYSIGLEYGYDYREIAASNNIYAPYTIKVGQTLNFSSLNKAEEAKPSTYKNEDGVIISPIDVETPQIKEIESTPAATAVAATLSTPKAIREPYSLEALNRIPAPSTSTTTPTEKTVNTEVKTAETKTIESTETSTSSEISTTGKNGSSVVEGISWSWPTQGKISAKFNAASNKGVDILGKNGQTIAASADGKVIYTGSDLRGYGKLVIIKHSQTLLSVYAHNSKINIKEGQIVKAGQKIAEMGDTDANSVKLHFEIRQKGKSVDPELFLPQN